MENIIITEEVLRHSDEISDHIVSLLDKLIICMNSHVSDIITI